MKDYLIYGLVALSLIIGGLALTKESVVTETVREIAVGAAAGPDHYNEEYFHNGLVADKFTQGGGAYSLSSDSADNATTTQAILKDNNVIVMAAGGAGQGTVSLLLPATSTLVSLLESTGDFREWMIDASALAAATTTTIKAGNGIDLIAVTTNDDVIDGGEYSRLTCWRKGNTDVACIVSELLDAD